MATYRALSRYLVGTGPLGIPVGINGDSDTIAALGLDAETTGTLAIGTANATAITIGSGGAGGVVTTVAGDLTVTGTTTLNATVQTTGGSVTFGDGDGDTIQLGGDDTGAGPDVVNIGQQSSGGGVDTDVNLVCDMDVSASRDLRFERATGDGVLVIPRASTGEAGAIRVTAGNAFEWWNGASWSQAGTAAGNTLQQSYDAGSGTIALDASGDFQIELDNATGDVFAVLSSTGGNDDFTLTSTGADAMSLAADLTTAAISASSTMDLDAAGAMSINSSGAAINIGNDANAQAINIGTGAAARTITIGNATGATAVNLQSGTAGINLNDGVAQLDMDGAGALTETALVSADITPSGTLTLRGGGVSTFGDATGYYSFDGSGALTETGITNYTITPSGTLTMQGGGVSKYGDDTATLDFDGAGAVSETGMTSFSVTPSGAITLTAGAASTWSTSSGALTLTSAAAATWSTAAGLLTVQGDDGLSLDGNDGVLQFDDNLYDGDGTTGPASLILTDAGATDFTFVCASVVDAINKAYAAGGTSNTMQETYDAGPGITLDASGDLTFASGAGAWSTVIDISAATGDADGFFIEDTDNSDYWRYTMNNSGTGIDVGAAIRNLSVVASGTVTITGAGASKYGDDTATLDFDGAGAVSETGMTSFSVTPSGVITLTAGATSTWSVSSGDLNISANADLDLDGATVNINSTGTLKIGDDTATLDFDGAGSLSETGMLNYGMTPSGTVTIQGGGVSKYGDDTATLDFNGAGAVTEAGMTSFAITPSGAITLTAGAESTWSTSSGDLNISGAGALDLDAAAGHVTIDAAATYDILVTVADNAGSDITFTAHGSATNFNEDGANSALVGFTEDNIIGALNELKSEASSDTWDATSGEALTQYAALCGPLATGGTSARVYESDATTASERQYVIGFTQTVAAGAAVAIKVKSSGLTEVIVTVSEAWVRGDAIYMSETAGEVSNSLSGFGAGDVVQRVGWAAESNATATTDRDMFISIGEPTVIG